MSKKIFVPAAAAICLLLLGGCEKPAVNTGPGTPAALRDVPAVRLNFRYEADVPAPTGAEAAVRSEERNAAVQADFDTNRPQEIIERTIGSPDKKKVIAVYHQLSDAAEDFRLDMYTPDGKLMKKLTSDTMAVRLPETIVWSPDSTSLAFAAMSRESQVVSSQTTGITPAAAQAGMPNIDVGNSNVAATPLPAAPTPAPPTGILTFKTEQIYISNADGSVVKGLTQNEGLKYFYYAWSPDSTMLAALATTAREWKYLEVVARSKGEVMALQGRPRIIEKNGRERRLDDNQTAVRPVWSPDSAKVAIAFDTQVRIYDALGTNPTQAAIPLRNQLLISSQAYERDQQRKLAAGNTDAGGVANTEPDQPLSTLPDEKSLTSYNPVVQIAWPSEDLLYVMTAFVKRMKNESDDAVSFARWHRLVLTAQPVAPPIK